MKLMEHAPAKENTAADRLSSVVSALADDVDSQLTPNCKPINQVISTPYKSTE
jgi:hypothetical protein